MECRKCLGENFPHHASGCPHRDVESDKQPLNLLDPDTLSACSYCGKMVNREEFLDEHSFQKCQTEEGIAKAFHEDGQDILNG